MPFHASTPRATVQLGYINDTAQVRPAAPPERDAFSNPTNIPPEAIRKLRRTSTQTLRALLPCSRKVVLFGAVVSRCARGVKNSVHYIAFCLLKPCLTISEWTLPGFHGHNHCQPLPAASPRPGQPSGTLPEPPSRPPEGLAAGPPPSASPLPAFLSSPPCHASLLLLADRSAHGTGWPTLCLHAHGSLPALPATRGQKKKKKKKEPALNEFFSLLVGGSQGQG